MKHLSGDHLFGVGEDFAKYEVTRAVIRSSIGENYDYVVNVLKRRKFTSQEQVFSFLKETIDSHFTKSEFLFNREEIINKVPEEDKKIISNIPEGDLMFYCALDAHNSIGENNNYQFHHNDDLFIFSCLVYAHIKKLHCKNTDEKDPEQPIEITGGKKMVQVLREAISDVVRDTKELLSPKNRPLPGISLQLSNVLSK